MVSCLQLLSVRKYTDSTIDFKAVDWSALASTVPAMFALTFFGILHVPINVPALGFSTGEDNVNVDRELIAHGISNALSGLVGSIQVWPRHSQHVHSSHFTHKMTELPGLYKQLALHTKWWRQSSGRSHACNWNSRDNGSRSHLDWVRYVDHQIEQLLILGSYIPIMIVGALIFLLGIDLLREALYDTWGKVHRLEYLTVSDVSIVSPSTYTGADCCNRGDHGSLGLCHWHPRWYPACLCQFCRTDISKVRHQSHLYG
jgi:SulP family sulfate permease